MRIGIDVDGVLADFNTAYIDLIIKTTGRDLFGPGYVQRTWHFPEAVGYTKEEIDRVWTVIKASKSWWSQLSGYPETERYLMWLWYQIEGGDEVYFITARPGLEAKRQTEQWLSDRSWGYLYRPTVLMSSHKGLCAQALHLDRYIDDRWENAVSVANMHWRDARPACASFLLTQPWNLQYDAAQSGVIRVSSIADMLVAHCSEKCSESAPQ